MMKQYGSFSGLDNFNNFEFINSEKLYILRFDNEDKYIANRYDVKNHLDTL